MNTQKALRNLNIDFDNKTPAALRRRRMAWTQRLRHLSQLGFGLFIMATSVAHHLATEDGAVPSIDALCPFGGVETLYRFVTSGGQYIPKTHASNVILLVGLIIGTLVAGGAFCGWVCPFGALQDLLTAIRKRLHLPEIRVPDRVDRVLRYGRYVTLAFILYQTIVGVKLWFADFDPYRTIFGLDWLFAPNLLTSWPAYLIAILFVLATTFVERGFCRYACPLGGTISLIGRFSLFRIRRNGATCKSCALCNAPCPVKLKIAGASVVSSDCIGCLACVDACPRPGALEMQLHPAWFDALKRVFKRPRKSELPVSAK